MAEKKEIKIEKLRVVEALQDDAYKGIARIDPSLMVKMKLSEPLIMALMKQLQNMAGLNQESE